MVTEKIAKILEVLTLIGDVLIIIFLAILLVFVLSKKNRFFKKIVKLINENYLEIGIIVALTATLGSLFYSEILGYVPCKLCWYQRILMYPQAIMFGIALYKKRTYLAIESVALSLIGLVIAAYHYLLQIGLVTASNCDALGYSSKCSEFFTLSFGYITIPMMALTAFTILLIVGIIQIYCQNKRFY